MKAAPLAVGSEVHASLKFFSQGNCVACDPRNTNAVNHLARRRHKEMMGQSIPEHIIDGSQGSMIILAEALSLTPANGPPSRGTTIR